MDNKIVVWIGFMFLLAIIYIIHLMGFITTLEEPKVLGKSVFGMIGLIWGLFGFMGLILHDTIKG